MIDFSGFSIASATVVSDVKMSWIVLKKGMFVTAATSPTPTHGRIDLILDCHGKNKGELTVCVVLRSYLLNGKRDVDSNRDYIECTTDLVVVVTPEFIESRFNVVPEDLDWYVTNLKCKKRASYIDWEQSKYASSLLFVP